MKKQIIFLQNIIAPYRVSLFNDLEETIQKLELNDQFTFFVYIMRITETNRNWSIDRKGFKFNYYIDNGLYSYKGGYHWHFNIKIIKKILQQKDHEIILGGSWNNLNVVLIILLKRLRILKNRLHIWSEANYLSLGSKKNGWIKKMLRSYVFNSIDGSFLLPGKMPLLTFKKWDIFPNRVIYFPNLIDGSLYTITQPELLKRQENASPVFLIVGRLHEVFKGILNFLQALGIDRLRKIEIKIAGDGPDKHLIVDFIEKNQLMKNVLLLGNLNANELINEYKQSNVFVLPSFSDQSPLTVVEAATMRLPLLISENCGNHYELLENEVNGYILNQYDRDTITEVFDKMIIRQ
jgi:glycosyltransferase involved in cell wall biosynthesis